MINNIALDNILFLDIETVPQAPSFDLLPEHFQALWEKKSTQFRKDDQTAADVYQRAGIYAEFGKVVCVSIGRIVEDEDGRRGFKTKSYYGTDEEKLLSGLAALFRKLKSSELLCTHNGREFDIPFMARRMLINGISLPPQLNIAGKKPWEVQILDTMELWKFGDYKSYTSLNLLAAIFDIPTPKDDIDGSQVAEVYWKDQNLERIRVYCEKDILTLAQVVLKFKGMELIEAEDVIMVD